MGVDHRCTHVLVSQEFLHGTDIVAIFQQMRGEAMTERVTAAVFRDTSPLESLFDGGLHNGFRDMVSAFHPGAWVHRAFCGGKDILPDPGAAGLGIFAVKSIR